MSKFLKDNKGTTLVEVLAAGVIMIILLVVVSKGLVTASNWFGESTSVRNDGEKAADSVEGSVSDDVIVSGDNLDITLVSDSSTISLGDREVDNYKVGESEVEFSSIYSYVNNTFAPDGGADEDNKEGIYETTRNQASIIVDNISSLIDDIIYSDINFSGLGISTSADTQAEGQYGLRKYMEINGIDINDFAISQEFKQKYFPGGYGDSQNLHVGVFFFTYTDYLVIASINRIGELGSGTNIRMVYDQTSKAWYRAPKDLTTLNVNYIDVKLNNNKSGYCQMYLYLYNNPVSASDGYMAIAPDSDLYLLSADVDISAKSYSKYCVEVNKNGNMVWALDLGKAKEEGTGAAAFLAYVKDANNGWTAIFPYGE